MNPMAQSGRNERIKQMYEFYAIGCDGEFILKHSEDGSLLHIFKESNEEFILKDLTIELDLVEILRTVTESLYFIASRKEVK